MPKAPRMQAVNIRFKQTWFDNFSGRQCRRLCREVVLSPQSLRPVLQSKSVNYFFDHNHTCGLLNISALHIQYGIQAFAKFKRPECIRLHLKNFPRVAFPPKFPRKVRCSQSWWRYCAHIATLYYLTIIRRAQMGSWGRRPNGLLTQRPWGREK